MPVKPGREHLSVVENNQIALLQQVRKIAKTTVFYSAILSRHPEHARGRSILEWLLGNQFFRKMVIEL